MSNTKDGDDDDDSQLGFFGTAKKFIKDKFFEGEKPEAKPKGKGKVKDPYALETTVGPKPLTQEELDEIYTWPPKNKKPPTRRPNNQRRYPGNRSNTGNRANPGNEKRSEPKEEVNGNRFAAEKIDEINY